MNEQSFRELLRNIHVEREHKPELLMEQFLLPELTKDQKTRIMEEFGRKPRKTEEFFVEVNYEEDFF